LAYQELKVKLTAGESAGQRLDGYAFVA
jgi:hypothetical protein